MFDHDAFNKRFDKSWDRMEKAESTIFRFSWIFVMLWVMFALMLLAAGGMGLYWLYLNVF
jgi:hypothetical protein